MKQSVLPVNPTNCAFSNRLMGFVWLSCPSTLSLTHSVDMCLPHTPFASLIIHPIIHITSPNGKGQPKQGKQCIWVSRGRRRMGGWPAIAAGTVWLGWMLRRLLMGPRSLVMVARKQESAAKTVRLPYTLYILFYFLYLILCGSPASLRQMKCGTHLWRYGFSSL